MSKFYLFMWNSHEAIGGLNDLKGHYDSIAEAEQALPTILTGHRFSYEAAQLITVDSAGQLVVVHDYTNANYMQHVLNMDVSRWVVDGSNPERVINA